MVDGIAENIFLVNAPAGSGKTTWIKQQIESYLLKNPNDNVLCITYTNRAAEELGKGLDNKRVYFGTIHSFINDFIGNFFSHAEIIALYWEVYKDQIAERIENVEQKSNWAESNEKYKETHGKVDLDTVYENIEAISYNEAPFNSLYRGALSHDDLISFTRLAVDKFPVIRKKISDKYQLIFIDEYQDTAADVLHIFYTSIIGKKSKLYLLGDKMQQIYNNYDGEFEDLFKTFNRSISLSVNYRTTPKIVDILNSIYNDETLKQSPYEKNSNEGMSFLPKVIFTADTEKSIADIRVKHSDALVLFLSNKTRFHNIGAGNLYDAYAKMEKYRFGRKYNAVDVLTKEDARENDTLLSFLFMVDQMVRSYMIGCYGEVLRGIRKHHILCNTEGYIIQTHSDKSVIKAKLDVLFNSYTDLSTTIEDFLDTCHEMDFIRKEVYSVINEDADYELIKDICIQEVRILSDYLSDPSVSTQHGVKGESHDTVIFVADNSNNPSVHMTRFFRLWSDISVTLSEFDDFYYRYNSMIKKIENDIGMKCSDLKADSFKLASNTIDSFLDKFIVANETNPYYGHLLKEKIDKYTGKKNVTNAKNCLKESAVYGPLCAYRLFYVGCSRARKNLIILVKRSDVEDFIDELKAKFITCGFEIEYNE